MIFIALWKSDRESMTVGAESVFDNFSTSPSHTRDALGVLIFGATSRAFLRNQKVMFLAKRGINHVGNLASL